MEHVRWFSYADGRTRNDFIPYNDDNFDGVADTIRPTVADFGAACAGASRLGGSRGHATLPRSGFVFVGDITAPRRIGRICIKIGRFARSRIRLLVKHRKTSPRE